MAVRFSWTVQEADGDAVVGANVDLYYSGGAKFADMTDNGDGSYYCSVSVSGKYDVYIGGTLQDEGTGIWITADDMPTAASLTAKADKVSGAVNNNLASLDTNGNLLDSGYDQSDFLQASHANANGAGGSATPATNKVHNAAAIGVIDSGGLLTATDVEAALAEIKGLIGTMDLSTGSFVSDMTTVTNALLALNNQLYDMYLRGGDSGSYTFKAHYTFGLSGATGAGGGLLLAGVQTGFRMIRDGSITGASIQFSECSLTNTTIIIYAGSTIPVLEITSADAAALGKSATFAVGDNPYYAPSEFQCLYVRSSGSGTITNACVDIEVTYGLSN